ncbi:UNVERIFIED_CONTAM: hypothetical protein FKN15_077595 [Acipenser sinensis]
MYHRALVLVLLTRTWRVRKQAQHTVRKLLAALGGVRLVYGMLEELRAVLDSHKVLPLDALVTEAGELSELGRSYTPPRILLEALCVITSVPGLEADPGEAEKLAQESLIVAHHPSIVGCLSSLSCAKVLPRLFSIITAALEKQGLRQVTREEYAIMHTAEGELYDKSFIPSSLLPKPCPVCVPPQATMNAVGCLSSLSCAKVLPRLFSIITAALEKQGLRQVTREEYAIMHTAEGELYDKSFIPSTQQESTKKGNLKRENKAYSYKEQILELELKEQESTKKGNLKRENKAYSYKEQILELELKEEIKKKKGIKEELQLTSKQKELMQAQLERESAIRKKLLELDRELQSALSLLAAVVTRKPPGLCQHIPQVIHSFLPLFKSPLAAPRIKEPFLALANSVMPAELTNLGSLVGHVTLRLLQPECELDEAWGQEELGAATVRAVNLLHSHTVQHSNVLSAPAFAFCFPFLKTVLTETTNDSEEQEDLLMQALQIINEHAQLRSSTASPEQLVDENGPELLPRVDMLLLLTRLIGTGAPRLQGLLELEMVLPTLDSDEKNGLNLLRRVWVGRFDVEEEGRALAERLWETMALELDPGLCSLLIGDVIHHEEAVRHAGAEALSRAVAQYSRQAAQVLGKLMEIYQEKLYRPPPVLDALGRVISEAPPDQWEARCGIALALNKLSQYLDGSQVTPLFQFFVPEALNDRHAEVRKCMLDAALSALNTHGKDNVSSLLPVFEEFLKNAPQDASYDSVRQSVVILMGSLAKHLDKSDPKVKPIVAKLITALCTPSQQVQESVAGCLPPLVPAIREDAGGMVQKLLQLLLESDKYAERKGAAYGLAGLVKGLGILSLKQLEIMATLTDGIQDKKNFRRREGALFAFEMLCNMLGKLFEPYVVHVLPHLLLCFGDGNQYVREAADDCAKAVMRNLSAHGVKLVLPSLLLALEEESWRTKAGSVELLGAMAFCAPKQLSSCLPNIVPKLTEVLTDSHVKVQKAGQQALRLIGSVIRNPEILAITPILIDALTDPSRKTHKCLQTLLDTKFVHFIDAPSLALIMPIVQRAFQDRSTDTRKMAAQIIGNMYSLTDQKDLSPYLPSVIPGLKASLLDPVPEVRTVSAKALGAMVKGMGESCFDDLLPWLMETLASEQSSVDRSGAAQGLAEVMAGLGVEKLDKLMPDVVATASKVDIASHVRDGYIMMFIYLPLTFGDKFPPYVGPIIPCILKDDENTSEFALDGLKQVMAVKSRSVLPYLVPKLTAPPVNTRVLAFLSAVAGDALTRHLAVILPALMSALKEKLGAEEVEQELASCQAVILSVEDEVGQRIIIEDLLEASRSADVGMRRAAATLLNGYVSKTKADHSTHTRSLVSGLVRLFNDGDSAVLNESWDALSSITKKLDAGSQLALIDDLHRDIRTAGNEAKGETLPGFCLPKKGVTSILPVLREGVLTGSPEQKEEAAKALGLVIKLTSAEALRPSVVNITGPLIRILGDRFSWNVKVALLETLTLLLAKVGIFLKPFLPQLQTTFLKALQDSNRSVRLRAAQALGKLIAIHTKVDPLFTEQLNGIRSAEDPGVRETMLQALRFVTQGAGGKVDPAIRRSITTTLLSMLGHDEDDENTSEFALDGLKQVMAVKSRSVLPYLVPKLTAPPVNTRVLAFLSAVAGDALTRHLAVILPALMSALKEKLGAEEVEQELASCQAVILSVEDEVGQRIIIEDLLEASRSADVGMRRAAATLLNGYVSKTKADHSAHTRSLVSGLVRLFNDGDSAVLNESWDALSSITKKLDAGSQLALIDDLHRDIRTAGNEAKGETLPGFCLPKKGVTSILPVLREGVLTGSPEQKEEAAKALGLVIKLTSAEALRPSVVNITGPLIRILGDRFSWNVKVALLETLTLLLAKAGVFLKPFLPQLQTTFLKALQDSNRSVRLRAAQALGKLIAIHTKVDPLFTEQLNGIRSAEDPGVRETMLQALRFVTQGAGGKVDPAIRRSITTTLLSMLGHDEDAMRMASAGCLGELCAFLPEDELHTVLQQHILAPSKLCSEEYSTEVVDMIMSNAAADRIPIATSGIRAVGFLMKHQIESEGGSVPAKVSTHLVKCLQNPSSDIKLVAEKMVWWVNKAPTPPMTPVVIKPILKALLDNTKDKNTSVRAYADQAIVNLLKMREGGAVSQSVSAILDTASSELLTEACRRSLTKIASQADSCEQIDDTILT